MRSKHFAGRMAEEEAARFLQRKGYTILKRNYRAGGGEVDIVAIEGATLVFVEVKARSSSRLGEPQMAVTPAKQARILRGALDYLWRHRERTRDLPCRCDVVMVSLPPEGGRPKLDLIRNAFQPPSLTSLSV